MPDVERLLADLGVGCLAEMRAGLDQLAALVSSRRAVHSVEEAVVAGVPVRRYYPGSDRHPLLMWCHGGGYVSGSLDAIDPTCRELAVRADVEVVSVGYRLAPEHPFPAGLEDCLAVAACLAPDAIGGDSAGGGLAAAVGQQVSGLRAQLLLCPWLDATLGLPSVRLKSTPDGLSEPALRAFAALYTEHPAEPGASPLHAPDLSHAPPAVVVTAGLDPLRDDGERYVDRLLAEGRGGVVRRWENEVHGFPGMTSVTPAAAESLQWAADQLRVLLC
ncbi:MAG: alpha/beta hydrolase [Mycobacteriales bacterium]